VENAVVEQNVATDDFSGLVARDIRDLNVAIHVLNGDVPALLSGQIEGAGNRGQVGRVVDAIDNVIAKDVLNLGRVQISKVSPRESTILRSEDGDALLSVYKGGAIGGIERAVKPIEAGIIGSV